MPISAHLITTELTCSLSQFLRRGVGNKLPVLICCVEITVQNYLLGSPTGGWQKWSCRLAGVCCTVMSKCGICHLIGVLLLSWHAQRAFSSGFVCGCVRQWRRRLKSLGLCFLCNKPSWFWLLHVWAGEMHSFCSPLPGQSARRTGILLRWEGIKWEYRDWGCSAILGAW